MTVNEFVKAMAEAGFDFSYRATDGNVTLVGKCVQIKDGVFELVHKRLPTVEQSRQEIAKILRKDVK